MKTLSVSSETELAEPLLNLTRELLGSGLKVRIVLKGYSMFPFLAPGNYGLVAQCVPEKLKIGDVVAYERDKKIILHRVWMVQQNQYGVFIVCRGDAQKDFDKAILGTEIIGSLDGYQKWGRNFRAAGFRAWVFRLMVLHFARLFPLVKRVFFKSKSFFRRK